VHSESWLGGDRADRELEAEEESDTCTMVLTLGGQAHFDG